VLFCFYFIFIFLGFLITFLMGPKKCQNYVQRSKFLVSDTPLSVAIFQGQKSSPIFRNTFKAIYQHSTRF